MNSRGISYEALVRPPSPPTWHIWKPVGRKDVITVVFFGKNSVSKAILAVTAVYDALCSAIAQDGGTLRCHSPLGCVPYHRARRRGCWFSHQGSYPSSRKRTLRLCAKCVPTLPPLTSWLSGSCSWFNTTRLTGSTSGWPILAPALLRSSGPLRQDCSRTMTRSVLPLNLSGVTVRLRDTSTT
jgi:hypothetical protein